MKVLLVRKLSGNYVPFIIILKALRILTGKSYLTVVNSTSFRFNARTPSCYVKLRHGVDFRTFDLIRSK